MKCIKNLQISGANGRPMLYDLTYQCDGIKKSVIIYIHGFNGFKDWGNFDLIAEKFALAGYFFIKMNLSHNGTTVDEPEQFVDLNAYSENNYSKELFDVGQMINWVGDFDNPYRHEFNSEKIILLGHSRGGGIAILKAYHDARVSGLITWASVVACKTPWGSWDENKMEKWKLEGVAYIENKRTQQQMPLRYQLFEDYVAHHEEFDIEQALKSMPIPAQFCHGTLDQSVPFEQFNLIVRWKPDADFVQVESDHVFGRTHPYNESVLPEKCLAVIEQNINFLNKNGFRKK